MPKTSPWYSKKTKKVYHNNTKCEVGNNIEPENKVSGTGGLPLCDRCKELNDQGK